MHIPESENFVSVREAAQMLGCSRKKVYQYVKERRLFSRRVGHMLILLRDEVQQLQPDSLQYKQEKTSLRQRADRPGDLLATTIHVRVLPGKQDALEQGVAVIEAEQKYTFTGSVARYIMEDDNSIEIVLIWKKAQIPDEAIWQRDLHFFQQAFEDILDWNMSSISWGNVLHHT